MGPRVEVSEYSDFCFGVKRAISLAQKALKRSPGEVFSLGPIIHNRQVVGRLSKKGLRVTENLDKMKKGTIVIRSHGATPEVFGYIKEKNLEIVDATCPFVKKAQRITRELSEEGYRVIIIGDKGHPEVKALKKFSGDTAVVVTDKEETGRLTLHNSKIGVISQTTQMPKNFQSCVTELMKKQFSEIRIFNTICGDTHMRQNAARQCSRENDAVIVVGGKNSANTKRLYEICKGMGIDTYHIEAPEEIKNDWLKSKKSVGIVSGASTPRQAVDGVVNKLRRIK